MNRHMTRYKEWLEKEGEKEGLKIKVIFVKDGYKAEARAGGEMRISESLFCPPFEEKERNAVGIHELAHLKFNHPTEKRNKELQRGLFALLIAIPLIIFWSMVFRLLDIKNLILILMVVFESCAFLVILCVSQPSLYYSRIREIEADLYAKKRGFGKALASYIKKYEELKGKSLTRRVKNWLWSTHPDSDKRIRYLEDC